MSRWLSSGGAYELIAFLWLLSALFFIGRAKSIGRQLSTSNDGCYLMISTTIFTMIGGAIGLLLFQKFFPWFILTSLIGAVIAPMMVIRVFRTGKRKY